MSGDAVVVEVREKRNTRFVDAPSGWTPEHAMRLSLNLVDKTDAWTHGWVEVQGFPEDLSKESVHTIRSKAEQRARAALKR